MKKTLVAAIIGLAATASVLAQGKVSLYNYVFNTVLANEIKYGAGSGGTLNASVASSTPYQVSFYYALGDQTSAINAAMAGDGGNGLGMTGLMTSAGTSVLIGADGQAGQFAGPNVNIGTAGQFPGVGDQLVTLVAVAYNGGSYTAGTVRGHSAAWTVTAANINGTSFVPNFSGMSGFAVSAVPEPSTFALAGLGLAGLLIFRRRK